jgi:hypothetical protein
MLSFSSEELLASCSTLKLQDHALSAVCGCLFSIFTAVFLHHTHGTSKVGILFQQQAQKDISSQNLYLIFYKKFGTHSSPFNPIS